MLNYPCSWWVSYILSWARVSPSRAWQLALCLGLWRCSVNTDTIELGSQLFKKMTQEVEHPTLTLGVEPWRPLLCLAQGLSVYTAEAGGISPVFAPREQQLSLTGSEMMPKSRRCVVNALCFVSKLISYLIFSSLPYNCQSVNYGKIEKTRSSWEGGEADSWMGIDRWHEQRPVGELGRTRHMSHTLLCRTHKLEMA